MKTEQKQLELIIFPIGKYKGQPIDKVLIDKNYCQWFVKQQWFEEKYPEFFKLLLPVAQAEDCPATPPLTKKKKTIKKEEKPTPSPLSRSSMQEIVEAQIAKKQAERYVITKNVEKPKRKYVFHQRKLDFVRANKKLLCWN